MRTLKGWLLAARIEAHWRIILRCRKKLNRLYDLGEPLSSAKMIEIGNLTTRHGMKVMALEDQYIALMKL